MRASPKHREPYRHRFTETVRFGDLDAMGHVNNLALLRLLETGRVDYMVDLELASHDELTFVLASLHVDFCAQGFYRDELACGSHMCRLGHTSLTFEQEIWRTTDDTTVLHARSIMVALADDAATPVPVPDEWRRRIHDWEPWPVEDGGGAER